MRADARHSRKSLPVPTLRAKTSCFLLLPVGLCAAPPTRGAGFISPYGHLERDLGVARKWLVKAVIFRRYLPDPDRIPPDLNWGRCSDGTRRKAELLQKGTPF